MKLLKILTPLLILIFVMGSCSLDETTGSSGGSDIKLIINEYLASNDACCTDEYGEYADWFEIYNYGTEAVDIGGMYVSDSKNEYTKHQIGKTNSAKSTIAPGGYLVIWCDDGFYEDGTTPKNDILHVGFKLGSGGDDITLVEENGVTIINELTFGPQTTDVSVGRIPDGSDTWQSFSEPTPGESNDGSAATFPPSITNIGVLPATIDSTDNVTISATVTDPDGDLATVTLTYGEEGAITNSGAMAATGDDYSSTIGPFADGKRIFFFITAVDAEAQTTISDTLSFDVGFVPPVLFINEFLASNDSCCTDEHGDYDDWIEIYNPGPDPVDIGGMYISDDKGNLTVWQIPTRAPDSTTIAAGGFIVLWADKQPEQGILHVNIKLSGGGEDIALTASNGTTSIDDLTYTAQTTDVSEGRKPDGTDTWENFTTPTPGASNN